MFWRLARSKFRRVVFVEPLEQSLAEVPDLLRNVWKRRRPDRRTVDASQEPLFERYAQELEQPCEVRLWVRYEVLVPHQQHVRPRGKIEIEVQAIAQIPHDRVGGMRRDVV